MNALEIVTALADQLRKVRTADGYRTDAGERVFELIGNFSSADTFPLLSVLFEGEDVSGEGYTGAEQQSMAGDFLIIGGVEQAEPALPLQLLQDIKRAIRSFSAQEALLALGLTVRYRGGDALPIEDGDTHAEVQARVRVEWIEATDP